MILPKITLKPQRPECKQGSSCSIFHKLSENESLEISPHWWLKDYNSNKEKYLPALQSRHRKRRTIHADIFCRMILNHNFAKKTKLFSHNYQQSRILCNTALFKHVK
jgi:hypothetical protein